MNQTNVEWIVILVLAMMLVLLTTHFSVPDLSINPPSY